MTLRTTHANPPLLPRAELDFELHLASIAVEHGRGRLTSVRRDEATAASRSASRGSIRRASC